MTNLSSIGDSSRTLLLVGLIARKAKDVLPQSQRVENLTWRLLHLNLKKERAKKDDENKVAAIVTPPETPVPTASVHIPISSPLPTFSSNSPLNSPHPLASSLPTSYSSSLPSSTLLSSQLTCTNCSTTVTPLWRRDAIGKPLCNACGLFHKLHSINRPVHLNRGTIKKRVRLKKTVTPQFVYMNSMPGNTNTNARLAQDTNSPVNSPTFNSNQSEGSLYSPSNTPHGSMPKLTPIPFKPAQAPLFHPHSFTKQPILPTASTQHSTEQLFKSLMSDQAGFSQPPHPQTLKRLKPDSDTLVTRYDTGVYASSLPYRTHAFEPMQQQQKFAGESECVLSEMFTKNEAYVKCKPDVVKMAATTSLYPAHTSISVAKDMTRGMNQTGSYMDMLLDVPAYPSSLPTKFSHLTPTLGTSIPESGLKFKDTNAKPNGDRSSGSSAGREGEEYKRDAGWSDTMMLSKVMQSEEPYGPMSETWLDAYLE